MAISGRNLSQPSFGLRSLGRTTRSRRFETLPVQVILNRINTVFASWEKVDESSWKNTKGKGAFHVKTTPQSIQIDCYGTEGKTMNLLADTLEEFKCPLYDPQVPVRYDEFNE